MGIFDDVLSNLRAEHLKTTPSLQAMRSGSRAGAQLDTPSNQQIIDATQEFYASNHPVVDTNTQNTNSGAQNSQFTSTMNGFDWNSQSLTQGEQDTTSTGIFGQTGGSGGGGIWGPTLQNVNANQLFTTIGVGINVDEQFIVGGAGGLGCVWDTAKREGPRGYGYLMGELGLRVNSSINVQCLIFNQLPSDLDMPIYGLTVSLAWGVGVAFQTYWYGDMQLLGFGIGAGLGLGGGATVFGGKIWNFG